MDTKFLQGLKLAVIRANRCAQRTDEAMVPIAEAFLEFNFVMQSERFRKNPASVSFKPWNLMAFACGLFRARPLTLETGSIRLIVATREQTRTKGASIYVPTDLRGRGTHFGALQYKKEEPLFKKEFQSKRYLF